MEQISVASGMTIVVAHDCAELEEFVPELDELASTAIEPNVFYEPWMLFPAIRLLSGNSKLRFVIVLSAPEGSTNRPIVCGFFPLEIRRTYTHFPVRTLRLWPYELCHLCSPLLRKGYGRETLSAFLLWARDNPWDCRIIEFGGVAGDGPLHRILAEVVGNRDRVSLVDDWYVRPLLERSDTAQAYLDAAVSKRHQKDFLKKAKQLGNLGAVTYDSIASTADSADVEEWINNFIRLEASGWKGVAGVALVQHPLRAEFFRVAMREAFRSHRLSMLELRVHGEVIAIKCNLLCATGSFAYMIAFDEGYSEFSPGLLLEIENIKRFHNDQHLAWMDSCADRHSPLFNRIWSGKRVIETVLTSTGSLRGNLWISFLPLLHSLVRCLKPTFLTARKSASVLMRAVRAKWSPQKPAAARAHN